MALTALALITGARPGFGQGVLENGANAAGAIGSPGQTQTWTFSAVQNDALALSVTDSALDPAWSPRAVLLAPDGANLGAFAGADVAQTFLTAPQTGSYQVVVSANPNQPNGTGPYVLRLAKAPGRYVVAGDDEGGGLTNGQNSQGTITLGDLDLWSFYAEALQPVSLTVTDQNTVPNGFAPWIRVWGPNGGATLANATGEVVGQLNLTAPTTGVYTVVVSAYINAPAGTGNYTLLATGIQTPPSQPPVSAGKALGGSSCTPAPGTCGGPCAEPGAVSNTGRVSIGNPCDVATGNKYQQVTDYETAGPNVLAFTRHYNSFASIGSGSTLGNNWRHSFDRRLRLNSPTSISAERADGRVLAFTLTNGAWATDTDVDLTLTQAGSIWTLIDGNDTTERYATNNAGNAAVLTDITARNGYRQTLVYDVNQSLTRVTDSYGRNLDFAYNGALLETLRTTDGLIVIYTYEASTIGTPDRLTSVSYGAVSQAYLYESGRPFALTGIVDENGQRFATWTYDAQGRALSSEHAGGAERVEIAYNDVDGTRTVTNALGLQMLYHFTTLQGVSKVTQIDRLAPAATRRFTYDANGYLASATDWNGTLTTYVNDARGLPSAITEAAGTPQARTTTIAYDARFHVPVTIAQPGLTTAFTYDTNGNVLTRTETDTTTGTAPYATGGTKRTWTYSWSDGLLVSLQGPRTDVTAVTRFTYTSGALATITNALGQLTQITGHTPGGRPLTMIDANGVRTQLTYDVRQRLLSRTVNTADGALTTRYTYDAAGNLTSVTQPDGSVLSNRYDAAHRLIGLSDPLGQQVAFTLDALGDPTLVQLLDGGGTVTRTQAAGFDATGRLIQNIGGAGQTTRYTYDANGNAVGITDPVGHVTQRSFDSLNRPVRVGDAAGGVTATVYDTWGRPLSVTAPNGAVTTYSYDGFGNPIRMQSPDSGTTVYRYDLAGNLARKDDAGGVTVFYSYDALDRILKVDYPKTTDDVTYRYDETGHGFGVGRLTSVDDATGHLARTYDERGNVVGETRDVNRKTTLRTAYHYDAADRLIELGYPSGAAAVYTRDTMGRITDVTLRQAGQPDRPIVTGVAYEPFGPLRTLTFGNGITETRTFDLDYRLTTLTGTGLNPVQQLGYTYDAADNVQAILDGIEPAKSQSFAYDALDRLTAAAGVYGNQAWTYDASGNRLTQQAGAALTSYTYAAQSNRLTGIQSGAATQNVSYTQTGNIAAFTTVTTGRPKKNAGTALQYNSAGRLSSVLADGQQIQSNTYDAFGQRLMRTGKTTAMSLFQYDLAGHLLEDADGQGRARIDYIYLGDRPVATLSVAMSNTLAFLHDDRLGTPQVGTDAAQSVVWKASYEPFGAAALEASLVGQNLRFPGQEYELDTGWHHNGFRDYAPGFGRYVEVDPEGLRTGTNLYAYSNENPLRFIDFWGLESERAGMCPVDNSRCKAVITSLDRMMDEAAQAGNYNADLLGRVGRRELDVDSRSAFTNFAANAQHAINASVYACMAVGSALSPRFAEGVAAVYEAQEAQGKVSNQVSVGSQPRRAATEGKTVADPNRIYPNNCEEHWGPCSGVAKK